MPFNGTIGQLLFDQTAKRGQNTAVRFKQCRTDYQSMSWTDFAALVEEIAFGLAAIDLDSKQTAAIFSPTSHLWVACDLATISSGAISVPLYPNASSEDIEYILNHCQAQVIFVCAELLPKLATQIDKIKSWQKIVYLPSLNKLDSDWSTIKSTYSQLADRLLHLDELRALGNDFKASQPQWLENRLQSSTPEDIATIIYTSGTTGLPKGVPLTHNNILSLLNDLPKNLPVGEQDIYFSYLPISHVFERICGEYYWLYTGAICAFAESIDQMAKNLNEIEPTLMLAVPRVLDRIYTKINNGINGASGKSRRLIEWAIAVGSEVCSLRLHKQNIHPILKLKHKLADHFVLSKIRQRIGKRLRFVVTGGAPASPPVLFFFHAIGIPVLEGYGLTETSAPTNVNRLDYSKLGTVGPVLPPVELKIAEDGEILVRGPSIFQGYFKDPVATKEAFVDGWFRTGDVGLLDADGYLKITDRKKDLIVDAAGKNIAPQRIESVLRTIPLISQAIVFGDKRKHLIALLTVHEHSTIELARDQGWDLENFDDLVSSRQLYQYLKKEINSRNNQLAEYEHIRRFAILKHDLSVESGELTASMKVKRNIVAQNFAKVIEDLDREEYAVSK